jgi:hypothetical protein
VPADGGDAPAFQFKCPGCAARLVAMHNEGPPNSNAVRLRCFVCGGCWDPAHLLREELDRRAAQGDPIWPTPPDLMPWEPPRLPSQNLTGQEFLERIRPPAPPEPPDFSSWRVSFCPPMSSPPTPPPQPNPLLRALSAPPAPPVFPSPPSSPLGDLWPGLDLDPIPSMVDAAGAVTDVAEAATSIATSMEQLVSLVSLVILIHAKTPGPTPPEGSTSEVAESPPDAVAETSTCEPEPRKPRRARRGRPPGPAYDPEKDRKIYEAWKTGDHATFRNLAQALGMSLPVVKSAYDRERKRRDRAPE